MAIRLSHTVIPVTLKLGAPARVSTRSSLPFSVGVSTFSGARPLVSARAKQRGESTEEDRVPIEDSIEDESTDELVDEEFVHFEERDFFGTACVPVYVMLPLGVIDMNSQVVEPEELLLDQLTTLKSVNVDGVMVDCWWGIVEAHTPQAYNWTGYMKLFQMLGLKIQGFNHSFH